MGRRPKWGRSVDGVLLLNKARGISSNTALQHVKRLFFAKRAGHTGSLDPLATGVLPICLGEATKFSQYLLDADKRYASRFRFGVKTETGDSDGDVVATHCADHITQEQIESLLPQFRGRIQQIPSMYSALKYQGKPFYQWARQGIELPPNVRQPRDVSIYRFEIVAFHGIDSERDYPEVDVEVHCSKGTYIRSLAEDLGAALGVDAHVLELHRQAAGFFDEKDAVGFEELEQERGKRQAEVLDYHLLPTDAPVQWAPKVVITQSMSAYFSQGQPVMSLEAYRIAKEGGMVRVCSESGQFLGLAELIEGSIAPKRVVNIAASNRFQATS